MPNDEKIHRRRLLEGVGAGIAGAVVAGTAGAAPGEDDPEGEFVVGIERDASPRVALDYATRARRTIDFGSVGTAVAGRFSRLAVRELRRRDDVRYTEPDGAVQSLGERVPWGVDRVDADRAVGSGYDGEGADLAVVDSGIDSDHPDLAANLGTGKAFVECGKHPDGSYCSETNGNDCREPWDDGNDHGTHCAGIAAARDQGSGLVGVSPGVTLHAVKVLGCGGFGNYSDVAAGIQYVGEQGWDVASMSLGTSDSSQTIRDACQYARNQGVLLVAAAGNSGPCTDCVKYPAAYPEVVAVTATTQEDSLTEFSSTGPEVEVAAPGRSVESTVPGGTGIKSGTSMATPHVAGAGASLVAEGLSGAEARDRIAATAEDVGLGGQESGNGLLDVESAVSSGGASSTRIGEAGRTTTGQSGTDDWHGLSLDATYADPVVVAGPLSYDGVNEAHVRLRSVGDAGFEFKIEEWDFLDGWHTTETLPYLAMENGVHALADGRTVEAGRVTVDQEWTGVSFDAAFDSRPVVLTTPQTFEGPHEVVTRQRGTTADGFEVRVQEEEGLDGWHTGETVGYVAVDPGTGTADGTGYEAGLTPTAVTDDWYRVGFDAGFAEPPVFVASLATTEGWNTAGLRYRNLDAGSVEVFAEEERSDDDETGHVAERVAYLACGAGGLYGQ
jgi:subtilisin